MDFDRRSAEREWMDDQALEPEELSREFDHLENFNRFLGGTATSLAGVARLLGPGTSKCSLLDVGSGGGDTARNLARWAQRRGLTMEVEGLDLSPTAAAYARRKSRDFPMIRYSTRNLFDLPSEEPYDIVHAALLLHHCPGDDAAVLALRKMWSVCRLGLVINDLHRHPAAYYGVKALVGFCRSRFTRHDAPLSVLRAFRKEELLSLARSAGLPEPEIRWRWAFRWEMIVRK